MKYTTQFSESPLFPFSDLSHLCFTNLRSLRKLESKVLEGLQLYNRQSRSVQYRKRPPQRAIRSSTKLLQRRRYSRHQKRSHCYRKARLTLLQRSQLLTRPTQKLEVLSLGRTRLCSTHGKSSSRCNIAETVCASKPSNRMDFWS